MRIYLNSVDIAQQIVEEHDNNLAIVRAARKLQAVLLKHALDTVKPPKLKLTHGLTAEEASFAKKRDGKIQAIKLYRDRTGQDLRQSKEVVEKYMQRMLGFTHWPDTDS